VRYAQRSAQIYTVRQYALHVPGEQLDGLVPWDQYWAPLVDAKQVDSQPFGDAYFAAPAPALLDQKAIRQYESQIRDMLYQTARLVIPYHEGFKHFGDPDADPGVFHAEIIQMARERRDADIDRLTRKAATEMERLEDRLRREEMELEREEAELEGRRAEQRYTSGEAMLSLLKGRTNYTLSRMSRTKRLKEQTLLDKRESRAAIRALEEDLAQAQERVERDLQALNSHWAGVANEFSDYTLAPYKKDIVFEMLGLGWLPAWIADIGGRPLVLSAFA
jgi:hypothetical protein